MSNIFIGGQTVIDETDNERVVRNYTPSVQEAVEETPDESEGKAPISDADRQALDRDDRIPALPHQPNDRAEAFNVPGEWISPVVKHRRKQAMRLPSFASINDLENRIVAVMRFDGAPDSVTAAAQKARDAVNAAKEAHMAGRHSDSPRFAASTEAKDTVVQVVAEATSLVSDLERAARDAGDEWFDALVGGLDEQRSEAAKALEKAASAYAAWRQSIAAADALAREQERWGEWHRHPQSRELNPIALIGEIRKARDIAKSDDDFINGSYLAKDYGDEIPPHTMAALKRSAEVAQGSFAEMVYMRLRNPHVADAPARESIALKDLRIINTRPIPALNNEQQEAQDHARRVDPTLD